MAKTKNEFIVVAGASAGGLKAVGEMLSFISPDLPIAVFVVLHLSKVSASEHVVQYLQERTSFRCKIAEHEEKISMGHVYVAPRDKHLLVKEKLIMLGNGPSENRWRPSIDVLFRSAAVSWKAKTIGIVLTGLLDDGTAGMYAIKKCGGSTIVQSPDEAEYPEMPSSVAERIEVDYSLSLNEIGAAIKKIIATRKITNVKVPAEMVAEAAINERVYTSIEQTAALGEKSFFTCPDCNGNLWEIKEGDMTRYRCHIGHSYSQKDLLMKQSETIEATLWAALRMMEEKKLLMKKLYSQAVLKGLSTVAGAYRKREAELEKYIEDLKRVLFQANKDDDVL